MIFRKGVVKMKKLFSILITITLIISSFSYVYALGNDDNTVTTLTNTNGLLDVFPDEIIDMINEKINNGETVYYGKGTTNPIYLSNQSIIKSNSDECRIPDSGGGFDFDMQYGNTYYSPFTIRATTSCDMKIYRTCTIKNDPCQINLKIIDTQTNTTIFDNDLYVDVIGTTLTIPVTGGHQYYMVVTPLTNGFSHASFYVYGE